MNRLEDVGYISYDDGLSVVDKRVRDAAHELVAASAGVTLPLVREVLRERVLDRRLDGATTRHWASEV
ncbi:uncharacterized protein BN903_193 [Halorubrum sp. AJ67]|nr:uncharacterized protein BN903_193 [Halorubrum sp. AJ67]